MAVGDFFDRTYFSYGQIHSVTDDSGQYVDEYDDYYLYVMGNAVSIEVWLNYHLFQSRAFNPYLYGWNYSTGSWQLLHSGHEIYESQSIWYGCNMNPVNVNNAGYDYRVEYPTDLWKFRHQLTSSRSHVDHYIYTYGPGQDAAAYDAQLKGKQLHMMGTSWLQLWTTNGNLTPGNTAWMNTGAYRGNLLSDSLKTRIVIH